MASPSFKSIELSVLVIYLVDDAADYRHLSETIFKQYMPSYSLRLFESGQAFLNALPLQREKANLVILDQHMPGLTGHQTLMALKQQTDYRSLPVVMMSADASHSEISSFYEAGAVSYLTKPQDFNVLKDTLLAACQYASIPQ